MTDITKRKEQPRNLHLHYHYYRNQNKPLAGDAGVEAPDVCAAHDVAESMVDAQMGKGGPAVVGTAGGKDPLAASRPSVSSPAIGNPVASPDFNAMRLSEPLTAGHAATSVYDHGVGAGRNPGVAVHHLDLQQSSPVVRSLTTVSSHNGDDDHHDRAITHPTGSVNVNRLDFAGQAGRFGGLNLPAGNPGHPADHQHRESATADNGSHSLNHPQSNYMPSMKSSLDIMRETMRKMG